MTAQDQSPLARLRARALMAAAPGSGFCQATDGSVLPFPPVPSASIAGPTLQESTHVRRAQPDHLPADAPEHPDHPAG